MNSPWFELAVDLVRAAARITPIADLKIRAQLTSPSLGKTYQDWLRVLDGLLEDGLVRIENGNLRRGVVVPGSTFEARLLAGDAEGWALVHHLDPQNKFARKFDSSHRAQLGAIGELAVIDEIHHELPPEVHYRVRHTSLINDSAGFDIESPSILETQRRVFLEVKTTCRTGPDFGIFLSRNECDVGLRNENWYLVLVQISNGEPSIAGHGSIALVSPFLPTDPAERGRWESVFVSIDRNQLLPGLP